MVRYRSILTWVLALVAVVLVSCGGPSATIAPPTYTSTQITRIQQYVPELLDARNRMATELTAVIEAGDWQEVSSFTHGPLGQALQNMNIIARNLLPEDQKQARQLSRQIFDNLVDIDQAGNINNPSLAMQQYAAVEEDFDQFLALIPQLPKPAPEVVAPEPEQTMPTRMETENIDALDPAMPAEPANNLT